MSVRRVQMRFIPSGTGLMRGEVWSWTITLTDRPPGAHVPRLGGSALCAGRRRECRPATLRLIDSAAYPDALGSLATYLAVATCRDALLEREPRAAPEPTPTRAV